MQTRGTQDWGDLGSWRRLLRRHPRRAARAREGVVTSHCGLHGVGMLCASCVHPLETLPNFGADKIALSRERQRRRWQQRFHFKAWSQLFLTYGVRGSYASGSPWAEKVIIYIAETQPGEGVVHKPPCAACAGLVRGHSSVGHSCYQE